MAQVGSQVVQTEAGDERVDLSQAAYLLEDPEGTLTIDDVRRPEIASRFALGSPIPGFTPSAYWMRFVVFNTADQPLKRWFDTGNRTLQEVDLYVSDQNGSYSKQTTGSTLRFAERLLPTSTFVFPVALPPHRTTELLLRVRSTGYLGIAVTPALWQPSAYSAKSAQENFVWTLLLGIGLGLIIVNLMLSAYLKDISYLLYALSLASFVWAICSAGGGFGSAYEYFWPNMPLLEQSFWVLTVLASAVFPVLFTMHLLDFRGRHQTLTRVIAICMTLTAAVLGAQVLVTLLQIPNSGQLLQALYKIGTVVWAPLYPCTMLGVLVDFRHGNRAAKFIVVAFAPIMFSVLFLAWQSQTGQSMSWDVACATGVWEWFVMAMLLADRFSQEVKAKLGAQETLVDTLKRSEHELEGKVAQRTQELQAEQARTTAMLHQNQELLHKNQEVLHKNQDLLANMLPSHVIDELTTTGRVRPAEHRVATMLFTDLVGFTQATATMPAERMVAELNDIFAAFDDITRQEGVEKIKTIGDAYMAVAGLSSEQSDHAQRCTRVALRMQDFMAQRNQKSAFKWSLRVGLHSGPVISGVVGKHKYAFDVWGDSVNLAARMESAGEAGKVNVSAFTYDLIQHEFECEYRGKIGAKGKGEVDMYFVLSAKPLSANDA